MKPPAFQFYAKDWMSSPQVMQMSMHHRGVYITLLAAAWESEEPGSLPLPIKVAAKSAGLDHRSLLDFVSKFPRCFVEVGGKLVNKKLRENWHNYLKISEKRSNSARARWDANAEQMQCPASASSPASTKEQEYPPTPLKGGGGFVLPDWVPKEPWEGFVEFRKKARKPLTLRAMELAIGNLKSLKDAGSDPAEVLNQSVMRGWLGLFEVKGGTVMGIARKPEPAKTRDQLWDDWKLRYKSFGRKRIEAELSEYPPWLQERVKDYMLRADEKWQRDKKYLDSDK